MIKRIFSLCLVMLLVLAVAGCGSKTKEAVVPVSEQYEKEVTDETPSEEETTDAKGNKKKWETAGGYDVYESMMNDDAESKGFEINVEKNSIPATLSTKWDAANSSPVKGGAEAEAIAMRQKVLSAKNTEEIYGSRITGKKYYISPDGNDNNNGLSPKTAVKTLNADVIYGIGKLKPGDALLFERGGVWRMSNRITLREGVIYGSYGTGEKPTLLGSAKNYASKEYWTPSKKANIWKCTIPDTDIGLIVFNHGELVGWKRFNGLTTLENNGDFYYNNNDDTVYLYFDKGNPGKYFKDIEICYTKAAFGGGGVDNVVIDNFRIKYYGQGGIYTGSGTDNCTVTNCEIGFVGGYRHRDTTRAGNAIQQWNSTDKFTVSNNWIYQCYDTGVTFQGDDRNAPGLDDDGNTRVGDKAYYRNVIFTDNVIEYCVYGMELWHGDTGVECLARLENIDVSGNVIRQSGYGWSAGQRPDKRGNAFYVAGRKMVNAKNYKIHDNIFDVSKRALMYWTFDGTPVSEITISNNTYYQATNPTGEAIWYGASRSASDQSTLFAAVTAVDTSPTKIQWLTQ